MYACVDVLRTASLCGLLVVNKASFLRLMIVLILSSSFSPLHEERAGLHELSSEGPRRQGPILCFSV